ncbi:glucosaminidase domain-containing protein [Treponema sp. TIM-1]|uniref:glucosaminidase domain-containing protein n=1 Tax=Treponema sp. TIM-1 TaxID=2898417 RepID=UPI00397F202B
MENSMQRHVIVLLSMLMIFSSCTTARFAGPKEPETVPPMTTTPVEKPPVPPVPEKILGKGLVEPEKLFAFLEKANPEADDDFVLSLAKIYVEEAAVEGVNHDLAFAQMCLETGFLRFGGLVTPDMNNFCGLGAIGPGQNGEWFPDPRTGVRAHIQHLKAYATDEPLKQTLVDPRYHWVRYGSAPQIQGLAGTWATDKEYGNKITSLLKRLYDTVFGKS